VVLLAAGAALRVLLWHPFDVRGPEPPDSRRRASGVLPVRIDVPRAGVSHQFVKPLVVDQETVVSLRYKRR